MTVPSFEPAGNIADLWAAWCGEGSSWVQALRRFGELGGRVQYWCGMPRSASAIPLTFALADPDGRKLECHYRLKDIKAAIKTLEIAQ